MCDAPGASSRGEACLIGSTADHCQPRERATIGEGNRIEEYIQPLEMSQFADEKELVGVIGIDGRELLRPQAVMNNTIGQAAGPDQSLIERRLMIADEEQTLGPVAQQSFRPKIGKPSGRRP